jgi:hypothetical protein
MHTRAVARIKLAPVGNAELDAERAHTHSSLHRDELWAGGLAGCFYCLAIYDGRTINDWTDGGDTALCPECGVDSVIGSRSGYPIERSFLQRMHARWFRVA